MKRLLMTLCLTLALWVAVAVLPVAAQELPTVTTYYRPPTVATTVSYSGTVGVTPSVAYYAAPSVSYYAAPVVAYSAPTVAYYAPAVSAPVVASTSYYYRPGLFRPRVYGSTTYYTPSASYYAPAYSSYYAPAYSSYYYSPRYFRY